MQAKGAYGGPTKPLHVGHAPASLRAVAKKKENATLQNRDRAWAFAFTPPRGQKTTQGRAAAEGRWTL